MLCPGYEKNKNMVLGVRTTNYLRYRDEQRNHAKLQTNES